MEPESSLPCSQQPTTGPSPDPDQPSLYHPILFHDNVTWWLKETATAWQQLNKHASVAKDTYAITEELLEAVFSMRSMLRPCH
jgi:hypothetical protein